METEEQRLNTWTITEMEGILLNRDNIKYNPGLPAVSKVLLNPLYGKFGHWLICPRQWPSKYQRMFWGEPITDNTAFQLFLFFVGNGGSPHITMEWFFLLQCWSNNKHAFVKRHNQLQWIVMHIDDKQSVWFTWSIFFTKLTLSMEIQNSP